MEWLERATSIPAEKKSQLKLMRGWVIESDSHCGLRDDFATPMRGKS
jgi:hypothetical protein